MVIKRFLILLALVLTLSTPAIAQVRFDAVVPAIGRIVIGNHEQVVIVTGDYTFYGTCSYAYIQKHRALLHYEGWQNGTPSFATIEAEDGTISGKVDRLYVAVFLVMDGDFGLPGRGAFAYPLFTNGDAVAVFGGGE